jgi:hypothetical protein
MDNLVKWLIERRQKIVTPQPKPVNYGVSHKPNEYYSGTATDYSDKKVPFKAPIPGPHKVTLGTHAASPEHAHMVLHAIAKRHGYGLGGVETIRKDVPDRHHIREETELLEDNNYRELSDYAHKAGKHAKLESIRAHMLNTPDSHRKAMNMHSEAVLGHNNALLSAPSPIRRKHHLEHMEKHDAWAEDHDLASHTHGESTTFSGALELMVEATGKTGKAKKGPSKRFWYKLKGGTPIIRKHPVNLPMRVVHAHEMQEGVLTELKKSTLASYTKKASLNLASHSYARGMKAAHSSKDIPLDSVSTRRVKGIVNATSKLTKEDVDLQELTRETLSDYTQKAHKDASTTATNSYSSHRPKPLLRVFKRVKGIQNAAEKLKEETLEEGLFGDSALKASQKALKTGSAEDHQQAMSRNAESAAKRGFIATGVKDKLHTAHTASIKAHSWTTRAMNTNHPADHKTARIAHDEAATAHRNAGREAHASVHDQMSALHRRQLQ